MPAFLFSELERDHANPDSHHDFGHDILPAVIAHGNVFAHDFSKSCVDTLKPQPYWRDVGTLDAYWEANMDLLRPLPDFNIHDNYWPIVSTHPDVITASRLQTQDEHRGTVIESLISRGCKLLGATVRRSMLFSHAQVGAGSSIEDSLLLPHAEIGRDVVIRRAIIDSHCVLPDGIRIGVNPVEDRARFTVSEQGVTLVTPEMLGQYQRGF